ncbi:MAG: antibiotic biosynthesis monooxygenase [Candidatus Thorarchaeota archaeon]
MISRIWHGYTTKENAELYEALLEKEIFIGIANQKIKGYHGIQLLRRELEDEVEFLTIMLFDSLESVRCFAGEDYEKAVVPLKAQKLLAHYDQRSQHYQIRIQKMSRSHL